MSFGFGGGGFGFGASQPAQSPFGGTAAPFGQAPFGQQQASSPFGSTSTTGIFGASQPAFGAAPVPAFGSSSTSAFGSSGFGTTATSTFGSPNPFGAASQPLFGASSTPAFGAQPSTPTFGATNAAFGSAQPTAFGSGFGAASTPAFGAASTPGPFGSTTPAFGSSTPAFGSGFGSPSFGGSGTRGVPYQKTQDVDSSTSGGAKTTVYFNSISAMPQYQTKSPEELRWEDYQAGVKGNTGAAQSAQPGVFGQQPAMPSIFGQTPQASSPFGQSAPAFGGGATSFAMSTPSVFGGSTSPAFGGGGAFGGSSSFGVTTSSGPFGAASTPAFGSGASSPFGTFGSTPAFGQTSAGAFGSTTSNIFGQQSAPAFGVASTPAFGSTTGAFGQQSAPAFGVGSSPFGGGSTPAFGGGGSSPFTFAPSASAFGQPASSPSIFGGSTGAFGQASTPAFGGGGNIFGQTAAKPAFQGGMFGSTSSPFGQQTAPAFGSMTGGILGQATTPSLGGIFAGTPPSQQGLGIFGQQPQQQQQQQQMVPAQPLGVAVSPYGVLPQAPNVGTPVPEYKSGISARPLSGLGPPRPTAVLASRSLTPRSGMRLRPSRARSVSRGSASPSEFLSEPSEADSNGSALTSIFLARDNPRQFFVREPLPSTAASTRSSPAAASGAPPSPSSKAGPSRKAPGERSAGAGSERRGNEEPQKRTETDEHENGGPPQNGRVSDGQHITDDEVAQLLPAVQAEDYFVEPSLTQLAAMAREDPDSLAAVSNFKIGRRGIGAVRWLSPTDVRGLNVDGTVALSRGSVEVYLDENEKPQIGEGLNKGAEVTLHKVYRIDKATNRPTTDKDAIVRFEKKLKKLAADQSARFISYDADTGTWVFEVEHFSKYGLLDSDDEDAAAPAGAAPPDDQGPGSAGGEAAELEGEGMQLSEDEEEEEDEDMDAYSQHGTVLRSINAADADARGAAASPVLPLALSAQLGLDPSDLVALRSSFFPQSTPEQEGLLGRKKRPPSGMPGVSPVGSAPQAAPMATSALPKAPAVHAPPPPAALPSAVVPAATSWKRPAQALQPPSVTGPSTEKHAGAELAVCRGFPATVQGSKRPYEGAELSMIDAGLLLGRSFRVGWGPNGHLVHPGKNGTAIQMGNLPVNQGVLSKGSSEEAMAALKTRTRKRWRHLLEIHAQHSHPDASAPAAQPEGGIPRTRQHALRCSRSKELHSLCCEYLVATKDFLQKNHVDTDGAMEGLVTKHEVWTWELLHVLFSHIPGSEAPQDALPPDDQPAPMEQEGDAEESEGPAGNKRRALLSCWLRDRARGEVEHALQQRKSLPEKLSQLLSGQQLSAAVALASAMGDVRLASLISQAAAKGDARAAVGRQLQTWLDAQFLMHIDQERLRVYQLLAGHIDAIVPHMDLDWRRAFGLHFWYGQSPTLPVRHALQAFTASTSTGTAPPPVPLYIERGPGTAKPESEGPASVDVDFLLLELFSGVAAKVDGGFLAKLLEPMAITPDRLNYMLPWLLLQTLQAIHALPASDRALQVFAVHVSLISQLEVVGGMEEWALYVAQHLPDGPSQEWHGLRDQLVQQLLLRHAPALAASPEKQAFLQDRLGLPPAWIAEALTVWARYNRDTAEEFVQAVRAADWSTAHSVLVTQLAPRWWCAGQFGQLQTHLKQLEAEAGAVEAAVGSAAWKCGALLYSAFFEVEALQKQGGGGAERLQAARQLAALLNFSSVQLSQTSGQILPEGSLLQQVVLESMAQKLASWLLESELSAADAVQRQLLSTSLRALPSDSCAHQLHVGTCALGEVLV